MKFLLILTTLLISSCASATFDDYVYTAQIEPFTTDGCSVSPEGTPSDKSAWVHCCLEHDIDYWIGGSQAQRKKSDQDLQACIDKAGFSQVANLYYLAVRNAGTPWLNTPWRWGYGWPFKHGYRRLTTEQRKSVEQESQYIPEVFEEYLRRLHQSE